MIESSGKVWECWYKASGDVNLLISEDAPDFKDWGKDQYEQFFDLDFDRVTNYYTPADYFTSNETIRGAYESRGFKFENEAINLEKEEQASLNLIWPMVIGAAASVAGKAISSGNAGKAANKGQQINADRDIQVAQINSDGQVRVAEIAVEGLEKEWDGRVQIAQLENATATRQIDAVENVTLDTNAKNHEQIMTAQNNYHERTLIQDANKQELNKFALESFFGALNVGQSGLGLNGSQFDKLPDSIDSAPDIEVNTADFDKIVKTIARIGGKKRAQNSQCPDMSTIIKKLKTKLKKQYSGLK